MDNYGCRTKVSERVQVERTCFGEAAVPISEVDGHDVVAAKHDEIEDAVACEIADQDFPEIVIIDDRPRGE